MPKLRLYSAQEISRRVICCAWSPKRIENKLKKHKKKKVDALWIAKQKDIPYRDRLWVLLTTDPHSGLAPRHIRIMTKEYIARETNDCDSDRVESWFVHVSNSPSLRVKALTFLVERLKEHQKKAPRTKRR